MRCVRSPDGSAVSYTYDAFGNLTSQIGESNNPFLYCSEFFDNETQTYYLRARYYNPANGRFMQQDAWGYMDTSDPLSLNLYTYCVNNPVMYVDPSGNTPGVADFFQNVGTGISQTYNNWSYYYQCLFDMTAVDGPAPAADALALAGLTVLGIATVGYGVYLGVTTIPYEQPDVITNDIDKSLAEEKVESKEKVEEKVAVESDVNNGTLYYHVTTPDKALLIETQGVMYGGVYESGYIYAWRLYPNKYAIKNSGAHQGVVISFRTTAAFESDSGIEDPKVQIFGPVVSVFPGPIHVSDVKIVG